MLYFSLSEDKKLNKKRWKNMNNKSPHNQILSLSSSGRKNQGIENPDPAHHFVHGQLRTAHHSRYGQCSHTKQRQKEIDIFQQQTQKFITTMMA